MSLTPEQISRYSRHVRLPQVGLEGQEKLAKARVLIVGLGGLGSPASLYLAAAGIGTLGLAEFDAVEPHNLQRQILHGDADSGRSKLESGMESLRAINPGIQLIPHPEGVQADNAVDLFSQYDVIVDGTDNFPTRYLNNDAAFFAGKPLVYGSVFQFEGQVSLFEPRAGGPCYRCLFPQMPEPGTVPNCEEAGVFGALCGVIGSYQAMEAIKRIVGIGESLQGRLLVVDSLAQRHRTLKLKPDPQCPLCGEAPAITEIKADTYEWSCAEPETPAEESPMEVTVQDAHSLLQHENPPALLDVREDFEVAICKIDGARVIPLGELPERYTELDAKQPLLVYCHHGMRSLKAAHFLRSKGVETATSIAGGIDAWAREIEPGIARY
ncbi:molybdopterin-synthase adenylyltransferase MoeB [Cerasicoccus fimbriatus]|uniref:molybdopterin-synthase adenylyltransferase MoeB n=1 Tax=Cerasicoccus fimbriatus TaxID=3014554 RepID=UPI0022B45021|nr:molybdopterin-synthase adenylyltransferase MoeB [Cerasicoccus sp. TK19100]